LGWFWRRGLCVELEGLDVRREEVVEISLDVYERLLGGRALGVYLWSRLVDASKDPPGPLTPSNPLVIAPGGLLGSGLSTASKTAFIARSPLTGLLGRSMAGGRLGLELRGAGYDFLAIKGSLEAPGLLVIDKEGVRVEKAGDLWGLRIGEARSRLKAAGFGGYANAIIGPAGENLSSISMIDVDGRQAGRTGLGAVMGSKKLKAILVKGWDYPRPIDVGEARRLTRELNRVTAEHPASKALVDYGTPAILDYTNKAYGVFPSLNWRRSTLTWCSDPESAHNELSRFAPRMRLTRNPCVGCARPCSQVVKARGVTVDGPEYETVYALGSNLGICSAEDIAYLNYLVDELGLDSISTGVTISWAIEAGEKGILRGTPRWGDVEGIARLIEDIAYRRGSLGELLADGVRKAAERVGGLDFAIHVKGLELPAYDARGLKGMALGFAVASRGGDHLTSGAYAIELPGKLWVYEGVDRLKVRGKGVLVKQAEDLMGFYDATGICKFSRYTLNPSNIAPLWRAVTGIDLRPGDLLEAGERSVNLERVLNLWLGLVPERDDTLPPRIMREPIVDGPSKGELVPEEQLKAMLSEYYAARGWSGEGIPLHSTLIRLDLEDLIPTPLKRLPRTSP